MNRLVGDVGSVADHHYGRLNQGHGTHCAILALCYHLSRAYHDRVPRLHHLASRDEAHTLRWAQQIHIEFDRQHADPWRHQTQRRIATRAIGNRGHDARVNESMLLSKVLAEWQSDLEQTRSYC